MSAHLGTEHRETVRADIVDGDQSVVAGEPASVVVEVTNLDDVIRMYRVALLGTDEQYVAFDPPVLALFPEERQQVTATITLPPSHPAGRRVLAFEVLDAREPTNGLPALAQFGVDVQGRPGLTLQVEPTTLETGTKGTFVVHLVNTGNTALEVDLVAQDAERIVEVEFEPARPALQPGQRTVVRGLARGRRPWFGAPAVRVLDVTATVGDVVAVAALAMMQRARIGRRLIAFVGLLLVVSLFAFVIALSFGRVADLNEQNAALVQQGLGVGDGSVGTAAPARLSGSVASSTDAPIAGAAVRLFTEDSPDRAIQTTVTDEEGMFAFPAVADGSYLMQAEAAGFGQVWFPSAIDLADATPVEIVDGQPVTGLGFVLSGRPGSVAGSVIGADVAGALVTVRIPEDGVVGSTLDPVASVVTQVAIDETGQFLLADLATPATYEIAVSKLGFATELRTITLKAGEERENVEILLRRGQGRITGQLFDARQQLVGGVAIRATDGTSEAVTRSLSQGEDAGTFELRNLATPGTYTITFSAPGFFTETLTLTLDEQQPQREGLVVVMTRDTGSLAGTVRDTSGQPVGGVAVSVVGADVDVSTQSLTVATEDQGVGSWLVDALPVPGTYTVRFTAPGYRTTALTVELLAGGAGQRSGVDAVLTPATARVSGRVTDTQGEPIADVQVSLESSELSRATVTSHFPAGAWVFDRIPPGAYTLTFSRPGSSPQTLLVDLSPGEDLALDDIRLEAQARVVGVVTRNGVGASDVGVVVYRARSYPEGVVAETVTGADGRFEVLGLDAPETYIIDFQVPAGGAVAESREVFLQPDETTELQVDL